MKHLEFGKTTEEAWIDAARDRRSEDHIKVPNAGSCHHQWRDLAR